ncbi:MAG TPA: FAD-binding oxidoreductase [Streptosporangiaceae bacterium]|jgi:NAD(P)H-flavin reductase|nr:FAD-binding oxidoreductase [Streptosporangiaceae bacterium]
MIEAAKEDEDHHPPWWDATVISHERRSFDIATFRVAPLQRLPYAPGQSVAIGSEDCPRTWRFYSMANAPRDDGTLDFHVRMVDGGALSSALTWRARPGTRLKLGPAVGALTLDTSGRDILMVAGSTGLAPLKALLEQISAMGNPPRVHLFFGARTAEGLYDLPDLEKMAAQSGWLSVTHAVSGDPGDPRYSGERGTSAGHICAPTSRPWRAMSRSGSGPRKRRRPRSARNCPTHTATMHEELST